MSSATSKIQRLFGGQERTFQLCIGEALELERIRNEGLERLFQRLGGVLGGDQEADELAALFGAGGNGWRIHDVTETIRLGLEGGGMSPADAKALVKRYVEDIPDWSNNVRLACLVIAAFLRGVPDDTVGKRSGEEAQAGVTVSPETVSGPAPSTGSEGP